jgi:phosphatidylethanolamine/phosphatidyl-N-methylethanolamine N-methyltransferase
MRRSDHRLFLHHWLRAPLSIGAVVPSGTPLARAMAAQIDPNGGTCVELGAGTGAITQALLETGLPAERLVVIERNPVFARLLSGRFPGVRVCQGDACQTHNLLATGAEAPIQAVVSGLPLLALPCAVQRGILRSSLATLGPDGRFIQFTYGLLSPVPQGLMQDFDLRGRRVATVWRNLPPARVWHYTRLSSHRGVGERLAA